jgi:hypothetical protein
VGKKQREHLTIATRWTWFKQNVATGKKNGLRCVTSYLFLGDEEREE